MNQLGIEYLAAKRALFDRAYASLNERQREAVYTVNGPLLVLAGAGSGKTTVLVRRIAFLIRYGNAYFSEFVPPDVTREQVEQLRTIHISSQEELEQTLLQFAEMPCNPYRVLAITFTNKAASEIKARIASLFSENPEAANEIWAGTFHSVCVRILRRHGELLGYRPNFTIYDSDDSKKAMLEAMDRCRIDEKVLPVKGVMNLISRAKDRMLSPEEFSLEVENDDFRLKQVARIYAAYQDLLRESNALDFDDLILQTVRLLQNHADVRDAYQRRFKYVCVDEYQDTNPAQFELTRLLAGGYGNLMVVGDDDQSIYKFRGATIENILSFDRAFSGAKVIKLEQNYRSTQNILDAANAVIAKNESRMGKTLWTAEGSGEKIHVVLCDDQNEESRRVVDIISKKVARGAAKYRDFAVLYRMNAQSQSLEKAFARSAIPYRILGGTRFADREEIRDAIAYLQLIFNHDDNLRLSRILNKPARKIGAKTAEIIAMIAAEVGCSQFDVINHAADYAALGNARNALESFAATINQLTSDLETLSLDVFYDRVLDLTGYRQMWIAKGAPEAERLENLDELKSQIIEYMEENEQPTLGGFLEEAALVADVDRYDENADAAVLMTIHSAKGLEFPVVILPGMEEGIFPSQQSIDGGNAELEEERRLAYVALTRAKKELFLLRTSMRLFYGRTCINPESRFLKEIPKALIQVEGERRESFERDRGYRVWDTVSPSPQRPRTYYHDNTYQPLEKKTVRDFGANDQMFAATVFATGDRVKHATFGEGEILSVKPMGADILYEIAFDRAGTKKLMGSYARLTKI
ncbi:MAG: ATP-dependent DNA helicase PcrA [Ruminococcaceae bacterium]|nr:ATP-dependent DNA helicase PcrA [Oscillospiraceae bacterium]